MKAWKDMSPLERITKRAQDDANRTGKPVHIYNLNAMRPLYVMRGDLGDKGRVTIIHPQAV